jgi:hypothetical protein
MSPVKVPNIKFCVTPYSGGGGAVSQWLRRCATNRKVAGSIPVGVSGFFIDIKSFRSHYGPGVDSASNRNEYQGYFLGVKSGRCVRLTTYHHPVPLSPNLGTLTSWNPLGLSRPVMGLLYLLPYSGRCACWWGQTDGRTSWCHVTRRERCFSDLMPPTTIVQLRSSSKLPDFDYI